MKRPRSPGSDRRTPRATRGGRSRLGRAHLERTGRTPEALLVRACESSMRGDSGDRRRQPRAVPRDRCAESRRVDDTDRAVLSWACRRLAVQTYSRPARGAGAVIAGRTLNSTSLLICCLSEDGRPPEHAPSRARWSSCPFVPARTATPKPPVCLTRRAGLPTSGTTAAKNAGTSGTS